MARNVIIWLLTILLPFVLFAGTTGKIAGIVTDKETGEPLPGVNVIVVGGGDVNGAATNTNGYYSIINIPVGEYSVKVTYMGKKTVVLQSVRVSLDLTTELNVEMENSTLDMEEVTVTAERKIIRKDETNTNILKSAEEISYMPVRGIENVAAATAGVVKQENSNAMNVRGGRSGETAIYIDGVLINDPYNNANRAYIPNEAIEEMSVQTGGFNAEYGDAMSGIVAITTNIGSDKYHATLHAITDEMLSPDKKNLGTYSYGYNEYTASLSGPIIPKHKHTFFISGTRKYEADWSPSWGWAENPWKLDKYTYVHTSYEPSYFGDNNYVLENVDSIYVDGVFDHVDADTMSTKNYKFNARLPQNSRSTWAFAGKVKLQLTDNIQLKTSYNQTNRTTCADFLGDAIGIQPTYFFNTEHAPEMLTYVKSINNTLIHSISSKTFYEFKFNWYDTERKCWDPEFKDDLMKYGDILYNAWPDDATEHMGEENTNRIEPGIAQIDYFAPGANYNNFFKNRTTYWGIDLDLTHQLGQHHTLKAGYEYKYHTLRSIRVYSPSKYSDPDYATDLERYRGADVRNYGYNLLGEETDKGDYIKDVIRDESNTPSDNYFDQKPYNPIIMSGYLQDKVEFNDVILNLGLRWDRIDPNAWMFKQQEAEYNDDGSVVEGTGMFGGNEIFDESDIKDSEAYSFISPRLGVSFPVTETTVFHAQFGKFYQAPRLTDLYLSPFYLDSWVMTGGYFTTLNNPNLRPPKTTSYEIGISKAVGNMASLQLTAYYKETEDLVQIVPINTDVTSVAFMQNGDFGTVKGFDFVFQLRRTNNLSASVNYSLALANGTGSASGTNYDIAWQGGSRGNYPKFAMPLDFNQTHTGSINLDYRYGSTNAPVDFLSNTGANMLISFNSGRPYTLMEVQNSNPFTGRYDNDNLTTVPSSAVNSATTPWVMRVDLKVDKRFQFGRSGFVVYATVINLFNKENVMGVWTTTGQPDDTGYLGMPAGKEFWENASETTKSLFKMREMDYNYYGMPRQIRLGVKLEL